jgi:hypothetical protein
MALAGAGLRTQSFHTHAPHEPPQVTPADPDALGQELAAQPPRAHERMLQMQLIEPPHQRQIGGAGGLR